jgi:hypothetical protein
MHLFMQKLWGIPSQAPANAATWRIPSDIVDHPDTPPTQRSLTPDNSDVICTIHKDKRPCFDSTYTAYKRVFTNWKSRDSNRMNILELLYCVYIF